jgi:hypothetical protein
MKKVSEFRGKRFSSSTLDVPTGREKRDKTKDAAGHTSCLSFFFSCGQIKSPRGRRGRGFNASRRLSQAQAAARAPPLGGSAPTSLLNTRRRRRVPFLLLSSASASAPTKWWSTASEP